MRLYRAPTRNFWGFLIALVFSATLLACTAATYYGPPRVNFRSPPYLYHIPGSYVYVVADMDVGIFFYDGYWYRNYDNFWFRARYYNGSWIKVVIGSVPPRLHRLPRTYRQYLRRDAYRIPHRDLKQYYKRWERDRYWDNGRGREQRKMKRKQDYRRERRRGSEIRERERDDRSRGIRSDGRIEDWREYTGERRERAGDRGERAGDGNAYGISRPAKDKDRPTAVKETKQPARPKKAEIKGKKDKKKGKKKRGGENEYKGDDGDKPRRGKRARPR